MAQSIISVRVEEDTKRSFDRFCDGAGLNPSVAINMFIKATLRERKIPFEISSGYDPFHSKAASTNSNKQEAWNRLQKYKGIIPHDIDEKAELAKARDEKYASSI